MAHIQTKTADEKLNFIASHVGLRTKTATISDSGVTADSFNGLKIVKAGTIYPANDSTAEGIVFDDVDVTMGESEGALIVEGRILSDMLEETLTDEAKTALETLGIKFETSATVTRE